MNLDNTTKDPHDSDAAAVKINNLMCALEFMATCVSASSSPEDTANKFRAIARAAIAKATVAP